MKEKDAPEIRLWVRALIGIINKFEDKVDVPGGGYDDQSATRCGNCRNTEGKDIVLITSKTIVFCTSF